MNNMLKLNTGTNKLSIIDTMKSKTQLSNTAKLLNTLNKENKIQANKIQKYHPKQKQYCCLYHYLEGKQTKGLSPCNNHVSLGVINPITTLTRQQIQIIKNANILQIRNKQKLDTANIFVQAESCDTNYHTHFVNEIERRGTLPKQLIKPRVYIEKIYSQQDDKDNFLYPKSENKVQYKQIYRLFKIFAEKTQFKDEKSLKQDIMKFAKCNNIKTGVLNPVDVNIKLDKTTVSQYLFSRNQFLSYLKSHNLGETQSQQFWQAAYNRDRFTIAQRTQSSLSVVRNQFVSMKAFVYNYRKFYLQQQQYYKNMFSESALRQRLIDLRLMLQPWYNKNIILKYKLNKWKHEQLQLVDFLKLSGFKEQSLIVVKLIQERNRLYMIMRTLAKSIFVLTDQKNIGIDVWENRVTNIIEDKTDRMVCFLEFVEKFKTHIGDMQTQVQQTNQPVHQKQQQQHQPIQLISLLQYLAILKPQYSQLQQKWLINWIRNIYKYLYFYKDHQQLYFDQNTLSISCKSSISIQKELISEFIRFKSNQTDNFIDVLRSVTQEIQEKMEMMPELQGKKQYLVECNYLAETLLRIVRKNDFRPFQILVKINKILEEHWFDYENCYQDIIQLVRSSRSQSQPLILQPNQKFFKQLFILDHDNKLKDLTILQNQPVHNTYTYTDAINKYENVKQTLGIQKPIINDEFNNISNKAKPQQKESKKTDKMLSKVDKKKQDVDRQQVLELTWNISHNHEYCRKGYCSLCEDVISTEVGSTISKVQNMADYLSDLLRDIN